MLRCIIFRPWLWKTETCSLHSLYTWSLQRDVKYSLLLWLLEIPQEGMCLPLHNFLSMSCYLFTCSMVQSPSWEANWFAASQEFPRISRNPKVHYRTHKRPPPASTLGQPNPVHIPTSHLLEIHPNIIHHLRLGLPSGLFPSGFPTKTLYTPSPHPYVPHTQPISFFSIMSCYYWM